MTDEDAKVGVDKMERQQQLTSAGDIEHQIASKQRRLERTNAQM